MTLTRFHSANYVIRRIWIEWIIQNVWMYSDKIIYLHRIWQVYSVRSNENHFRKIFVLQPGQRNPSRRWHRYVSWAKILNALSSVFFFFFSVLSSGFPVRTNNEKKNKNILFNTRIYTRLFTKERREGGERNK